VMAFKPGQSEAAGGVFISDEYAPTLQSVNNGSTAVPAVLFDPTARQPEWSLGKPLKCAGPLAVAFTCSEQANGYAWERDQYPTLNGQVPNDSSNIQQGIRQGMSVRRLTPRECERLQGFPDDWTAISYRGKPAADGPRYRTLGNSMAVPVVKWIIERIARQ
jgi:site-specific DNA-cytosine methylase